MTTKMPLGSFKKTRQMTSVADTFWWEEIKFNNSTKSTRWCSDVDCLSSFKSNLSTMYWPTEGAPSVNFPEVTIKLIKTASLSNQRLVKIIQIFYFGFNFSNNKKAFDRRLNQHEPIPRTLFKEQIIPRRHFIPLKWAMWTTQGFCLEIQFRYR